MPTPTKTYYKIAEAAEMTNVSASALRYWESEFEQLDPRKVNGQRRYTPADIDVIKAIHELLRVKGLSLEYAKEQMRSYRKYRPRKAFKCPSAEVALKLLSEARSRIDDAHAIARIEAVEGWIKGLKNGLEKVECSPKNRLVHPKFTQNKN